MNTRKRKRGQENGVQQRLTELSNIQSSWWTNWGRCQLVYDAELVAQHAKSPNVIRRIYIDQPTRPNPVSIWAEQPNPLKRRVPRRSKRSRNPPSRWTKQPIANRKPKKKRRRSNTTNQKSVACKFAKTVTRHGTGMSIQR